MSTTIVVELAVVAVLLFIIGLGVLGLLADSYYSRKNRESTLADMERAVINQQGMDAREQQQDQRELSQDRREAQQDRRDREQGWQNTKTSSDRKN